MSQLFTPITIKNVTVRNRAWMSPMCQYSASPSGDDLGRPNDWHYVHYASRGWGGVGAIIVESTAVTENGRISPYDLALHNDDQIPSFTRLAELIASTGATAGIQLGHAGRKGSGPRPWEPEVLHPKDSKLGWEPVAPSPIRFSDSYETPHELTEDEILDLIDSFAEAARRAVEAGFKIIELHGAHGYLIHEFLSPLSNKRTDRWGQDRVLFGLEVIKAVRAVVPDVLAIRISATDWCEFVDDSRQGWTVAESVEFIRRAKELGLDFVDVSTGGNIPDIQIPAGPGYQVRFAAQIAETGTPTGSVGLITEATQAEQIVRDSADVAILGRVLLSDPYVTQAWRARLREEPEFAQPYHRQLMRS